MFLLAGCASARHYQAPAGEIQNISYRPPAAQAIAASPITALVWPVRGDVVAPFGDRTDDFRNKGIDIRAAEGSPVHAAAAGKVVYSDNRMRGFGKTVIIDHGNNMETVYAYNSDIVVELGALIAGGDVIARVGSTGRAKKPCLHFEVRRNGEPVDPMLYLK